MKKIIFLIGSCLIVAGCDRPVAPAPEASRRSKENMPVDPANTAVNVRDRSEATKTPLDQNENQPDIDITAGIRKRVVSSNLSTDAHNVKIITQDGLVTLRGPVKSAEEKQQVEAIAQDVAGHANVNSQLEITP